MQTDTTVTACAWDAERCRWSVADRRRARRHEADALILATGQLAPARAAARSRARETFAGHSFHSAEWDHDYPLAGKRVAVIGTGASAVQFVPEIAPQVRATDRLPAHRQLVPAAQEPALPCRDQGGDRTRPGAAGVPAEVRVRVHRVAHARDPPPPHGRAPRRARARPAFMRSQLQGPGGAREGVAGLHVRLQAHPLQLALPAGAAARRTSSSSPTRSRASTAERDRHRGRRATRARLRDLGDRLQDQRLHVPDARSPAASGLEPARVLVRRRARAPRHLRARLPEHVRHVRAQHEHLGRLDHRLPRGAGGLHPPGARSGSARVGAGAIEVRARGRGRQRPRAAGALRRNRVDAVRLLVPRRERAASSPTGRATCASTSSRPRSWTQPSTASRRCPNASHCRDALRVPRRSNEAARCTTT